MKHLLAFRIKIAFGAVQRSRVYMRKVKFTAVQKFNVFVMGKYLFYYKNLNRKLNGRIKAV
jgi:hypothetical protein